MNLLNSNGKSATPGIPCIYQLTNGTIFYSETAKEDADSFVFDGAKTLVVSMSKGKRPGEVSIEFMRLVDWGYKAHVTRIFKTSVAMIQDTSEPAIMEKAREALSGIVLAGPGTN